MRTQRQWVNGVKVIDDLLDHDKGFDFKETRESLKVLEQRKDLID